MTPDERKQLEDYITSLNSRITALETRSLSYPLDVTSRRVVNENLPVYKRDSNGVFTFEINDRERPVYGLPDQTSNSGKYLKTDGTNASWATVSSGGGTDSVTLVVGPSANSDSSTYDYTTDGTDDDVQIQSAIDALSGGGKIVLREGTYTLGNTVLVNEANTTIQGMGDSTIVKAKNTLYNGTTIDTMMAVSVADAIFIDIYFDGNSANQSNDGSIVDFTSEVDGGVFVRCKFINAYGTSVLAPTGGTFTITSFYRCVFNGWDASASTNAALAPGSSVIVSDCSFINTGTGSQYISGDSGLAGEIRNCYFSLPSGYNAFAVGSITGKISGCYFIADGSLGSSAVFVLGSTQGLIMNNIFDSGTSANIASVAIQANSAAVCGNEITGFGNAISNVSNGICSGNHILGTFGHAIKVNGDDSLVVGNIIGSLNPAADNTYSGIQLGSNVDHCVITSNHIDGLTGGNDLKYCIEESTGCDYNIIEHNNATGADTSQISTVGANTISSNNITA